jgi:hypothetical protein
MINHARTLLLNLPAVQGIPPDYEEYIPANFAPVVYSGHIAKLREALVPQAPRASACFRAYALMSIAQVPDFMPYVIRFDSRLTYDIMASKYMAADQPRASLPAFDMVAVFNAFNSAVMNGGISVFTSTQYADDVAVFKDTWTRNNDVKSRLAAGILATVYAMETERQHVLQS